MKRDYGQHCALARALDAVGSRWTMLMIRELLPGPRRFKDLLDGLPGMGTNLLTDRLRHLEQEGVIRRRQLPPPAGSTVYELTGEGRRLEESLFELARWGMPRLGERRKSDALSPRWAVLAMKATLDEGAARGIDEVYEFRIDGDVFTVDVGDGSVRVLDGPAVDPDAIITTDVETFYRLTDGEALAEAVADGRLRSEGDPAAILHCTRIFGPPAPAGVEQPA